MLDVLIIGAGPVGLACALETQRKGLKVAIAEKGALVNSLVGYPTNMEFFSTPELLEIGGYPFPTAHYKPLREDALDYYQRVARDEKLDIRLHEKVLKLDGEQGNFTVSTSKGAIPTRNVILATGFYDLPNLLGVPGEDLPHVSHYYKEPYQHVLQHVVVIGAKNSSAKAALQLTRAGAKVTLIVRGPEVSNSVKYWIRPDLINRIAEGRITAHFNSTVTAIHPEAIEILTPDGPLTIPTDFVYALTGYHPDEALLGRFRVEPDPTDEACAPLFNPQTHETSRRGVFVAGTVCGGRATSRWFIENGRHHAQLIAAYLAGQVLGSAGQ
ncbi:YpdA family putative bacillithiol disulfide reductase [Microvirga sp. STS02]|uniref:YpdA family putative bacillithiol disulfide reductase n=1 Tax=Hymenobacter negativus TaxID=2795026 RepID=UPI0018DDBEEF|nr:MULTISPECIES: YpdA family putative bacillithiol disulfide reductase [Bacteria]MBH8570458.1 YpdA family putative bacillithiol disulfide reductase [Hymenobacter negativus]MBR7210197.1 YpdA family putative bacillithiol disulfide reductase [Microvirga sp. STS02]